ncbi:MAG TPA: hypothetical protein IAB21_06985 [Candidatus Avelusimicrobium excrementipullorum]|nr:hypothetical protein [Candidatus Avelusimicrobium excrementipullorum]
MKKKENIMELKNGPVSTFKLFFYSLKAANQAFGTVLALAVMIVFFVALLAGICIGVSVLINSPFGLKAISLPLPIINAFLQIVFMLASIRILGARFEKAGISAYESFRDAVVPAVYFIISSLILSIIAAAVFFVLSLFNSSMLMAVGLLAVCLAMLPFCFTQQALILRAEGPISALRYSWELGVRHYVRILLTSILLILFFVFLILALFCILKALLPAQYAFYLSAQGMPMLALVLPILLMQVPKLYLLLGGFVLFILWLYFVLFAQGVWTGLFLNLDYLDRNAESRELNARAEAAAAAVNTLASDVMPDVSVKQASVRTDADPDTARHLDQVYRAQEHLARALEQEEDRMPTILFDEDMARQLAESEEKMRQSKEAADKRKDDEEPKSIQMSNKSL